MPYFTMPRGGQRFGAGRKKGSVGVLSMEVREQLRQRNFNPLERLIDMCEDEATDIHLKARILIELCQYYYPKCKPIDPTKEDDKQIIVTVGIPEQSQIASMSNDTSLTSLE